jgi:hypothetical protein
LNLRHILATKPSRINSMLVIVARSLALGKLVEAMKAPEQRG